MNLRGYLVLVVVIRAYTVALTPRSRTRTRTTGYAAASLCALFVVIDAIVVATQGRGRGALPAYGAGGEPLPMSAVHAGGALTVAVSCSRGIRTRRAHREAASRHRGPVAG